MNYYDAPPETRQDLAIMPAALEAERAVLGSILIDPDSLYRVMGILTPVDFHRERHGWIFEAMVTLMDKGEPIDFITLQDELEQRGRLEEIGGPAYLSDLLNSTPTSLYASYYAGIVRDKRRLRSKVAAAQKAFTVLLEEGDTESKISEADRLWESADDDRPDSQTSIASVMEGLLTAIDDRANNRANPLIQTPWGELNKILGGLSPSDLIVIGGRPGMGKTQVMLNIGNHAMEQGARVGLISLEMSTEQMLTRILAMRTKIDGWRLRGGKIRDYEWPALYKEASAILDLPIRIEDKCSGNVNKITSLAQAWHYREGLDLLLVDYLQLMQGGQPSNRNLDIGIITSTLKQLARSLNVPIVLGSQLSRAVESRANKRPQLSDLRDSGNVEQDADVVIFVYRDDYYNPDTDEPNITELNVAKFRHGGTGNVRLYNQKEIGLLSDIERIDLGDWGE